MAKKNYYAVAVGKVPGIYYNWNDCKAQVIGYPGAVYKGFETLGEADTFMKNAGSLSTSQKKSASKNISAAREVSKSISDVQRDETGMPLSTTSAATAYVDGSYNVTNHTFSYGVVMFYNGEEFHLSKQVDDKSLADMRNVAGEICGSMAAMRFAIDKGCKTLDIFHDYEGIAKWPLGLWKTNKEGTSNYKKYYDSISGKMKVTFHKVKGHSNDKYNDIADQLAKSAIF